mmetsp:Transcript_1440/g.2279  ORF Transcript_1440/g.2279 Transcript_1440/m.2279 type:complete len:501 (-) Transcript_1440:291-1793(-)|eukprot:CAMPEP_0195293954 /NCGR_PEP_ID=MMETSP0707-20130614/13825_1 /TAXON_ID=33640 /ORGANISM="Asterionellopsis glacialis, Strain CCMP134" /LENGTH=500 /DNA_ID=CAMNT_0040354791 /DNA_START=84 /DNA_END=1586 /DNA_ORIENTATION=+
MSTVVLFRTLFIPLLLCAFLHFVASAEEGQCTDDSSDASCSSRSEHDNDLSLQQEILECADISCVATTLASSESFREEYFEKQPLLLHVNPTTLQDAKITWEGILDLVSNGLMWGGNTNGVRFMTNTYFESYDGSTGAESLDDSMMLKGTPALKTQLDGPHAIPAVQTSTLHIGAIQAIHPGAAKLLLEFQRALGLAVNGNLYSTPANFKTAAALHTDRMDGYVFQTSGRKRWQVYEPIPPVYNPVWGVHENAEWGKENSPPLTRGMVGKQVMDVVLKPGDILYVPRGFPHTTSTLVDTASQEEGRNNTDKEPSIAITLNTHTEAHHLVYEKLVRCTLARSGYCEQPKPDGDGKYCPIGRVLTKYALSEKGKSLRQSLPVGFLNEGGQWMTFVQKMAHKSEIMLKAVLDMAEEENIPGLEDLLDDTQKPSEELVQTAGQVFRTQTRDLEALERTFAGNNDEVQFSERQQHWAQMFGRTGPFVGGFCHEGGPNVFFMDYFM